MKGITKIEIASNREYGILHYSWKINKKGYAPEAGTAGSTLGENGAGGDDIDLCLVAGAVLDLFLVAGIGSRAGFSQKNTKKVLSLLSSDQRMLQPKSCEGEGKLERK